MSYFRKNLLIGLSEIFCRLPLIFTVGYLARSIGADNYGNWALVVAFQVFLAGIAGLGLSGSISRFASVSNTEEANSYLTYAIGVSFLCLLAAGVVTLFVREPIGLALGIKADFRWLLPVAVLTATGSIADGFLNAYFKARMAVGRQVAYISARTLSEIVAVLLIFAVNIFPLESVSLKLAAYVGVLVACKLGIYPWLLWGMGSGLKMPGVVQRREFLRYGIPMVPTMLMTLLIGQGDRLVLSHFAAKHDLGVYAFGATIASYVIFLGYAVYPLLLPRASQLHDAGDLAGVRILFQETQKLFMPLWAGAMLFLALWNPEIIAWTAGNAYAGAGKVLLILAFSSGIDQLFGISEYMFYLVKRTDRVFWLYLIYAAMLLSGLALAGLISGTLLAPWAVLAATIAFNFLRYRIAQRHLYIPVAGALLLQVLALAVFTLLVASFVPDWNFYVRIALTAIIAIFFAALALKKVASPSFGLSQN
jgi:O-antigen/teichoic acid export membrane protein